MIIPEFDMNPDLYILRRTGKLIYTIRQRGRANTFFDNAIIQRKSKGNSRSSERKSNKPPRLIDPITLKQYRGESSASLLPSSPIRASALRFILAVAAAKRPAAAALCRALHRQDIHLGPL